MADKADKYNDNKARYLATLIVQNMHNKNLGLPYSRVVGQNLMRKSNIDFWINRLIGRQEAL